MARIPSWAREKVHPHQEDSDKSIQKMREDIRRERMLRRGVGHLPLDQDEARRELSDEQRALRSTRPPTRFERQLAEYDEAIDQLHVRLEEVRGRVVAAEASLRQAPERDARTLADWIAAGERGERPAATVYERQRDLDAAKLHENALAVELDRLLQRRVDHVDKNRKRMMGDARKEIEKARQQIVSMARELPALRERLLAARETLLWASSYPERTPDWPGTNGHVVALNLLGPIERTLGPGVRGQFSYDALVRLIEEDAMVVANQYGPDQATALGIRGPRTPEHEAMWIDDDGDPDVAAWKKSNLERARQLAEYGHDPSQLAQEISGERA